MKDYLKKVNEINAFLLQKLLKKEYKIIDKSEYTILIEIKIDGEKYYFNFWLGNGWEYFECYEVEENHFKIHFTNKQRQTLFKRFTK